MAVTNESENTGWREGSLLTAGGELIQSLWKWFEEVPKHVS